MCAGAAGDFFWVDVSRQVPTPSAHAWSINLAAIDGPRFIVLRLEQQEAQKALVRHLVEIGAIDNTIKAGRVVGVAPIESVGVVW